MVTRGDKIKFICYLAAIICILVGFFVRPALFHDLFEYFFVDVLALRMMHKYQESITLLIIKIKIKGVKTLVKESEKKEKKYEKDRGRRRKKKGRIKWGGNLLNRLITRTRYT